jgi:hypothetical protein
MGHKAKRSKERKTRASQSPNVTSPLDQGFPSTLPPAVAPPQNILGPALRTGFDFSLVMHEELQLRIASDCKVFIQFKGNATQSAIRKLITYLEMALVDFPKNSDEASTQD